MARSGKTAQEFIQTSFSPVIAVLCSPKAEATASKNNLTFAELLQPFTFFDWEAQLREPNGTVCTVKNWKLVVRDVNWKPLQPTEARRQLNNAVLLNYNERTTSLELDGKKLSIPQSTPWFDAWRETYLEVQFPSDHEFTKHFLSCILVGSTHDENIVDTFNSLNQQFAQLQNVTPPKLPKWFNSNVLKTYVLLHDFSSVSPDKAENIYETMKQHLDMSNCLMLVINSRNASEPILSVDFWAPYLKRHSDPNNENPSILPGTPLDQPAAASTISGDEYSNGVSTASQDTSHPLTNNESDSYDNANSLQTHSFSGSVESVSIHSKVFDMASTEVHGAALSSNDIENIKNFLREYAVKFLLPYIEKQISILTEVVANRKGVSRSLLSATKRWFGTGKTGNSTGNNSVIYTSDCPELQLRRLGDLWFMCGQWQRAYDAYHTAKREFHADAAWLCYAGALEMAALSAFMAGDNNRKTMAYMEESIVTYSNTCRMVQYAVRASLLSALCLSSSGLHGEAAKHLIRMTSEDSDLRSAMLLEQASLCFLSGPGSRAMRRKYAFHIVLAGHRFSKAGQKKHSYRCYKQAYQVYGNSGWRLSTDHVQFALGRLAGALRDPRAAAAWLAAPLAPDSRQPPHQHRLYLRDYVAAHLLWMESCTESPREIPCLPLPLLEREQTVILCSGPAPLSSPGRVPATSITLRDAQTKDQTEDKYWNKMEQMLIQVAKGSLPMIFKPTVNLYTVTTDTVPSIPQGEPIQISITLRNPLKVSLLLKNLELLWQFLPNTKEEGKTNEWISNEPSVAAGCVLDNNFICGQKLKSVTLEGDGIEAVTFSLTPLQVGQLVVCGVAYKLVCVGEESNGNDSSITISGKLNLEADVSDRKPNETYKCLRIDVIPCAPCLQMTFSETSSNIISGEMRSLDVEFRNVGPVNMEKLYLAVSHPDCLQVIFDNDKEDNFKLLYEDKYQESSTQMEERQTRWRESCARHVRAAGSLTAGTLRRAELALRPRRRTGPLYLLAYYTADDAVDDPRPHRLLRHVFRFQFTEAVEISATPYRSVDSIGEYAAEKMSLAVEVKNLVDQKTDNLTLRVVEASLLSRQWKFTHHIPAARDKNDTLSSREKAHLIFEATRIRDSIPNDKIEWSSLKIAKSSPDSEPNVDVNPYAKFVVEYDKSFVEDEDYFLRDTKSQSDGLIQSMLVIRWQVHDKDSNKSSVGQHCLWLDCFSRVSNSERNQNSIELPLDDSDSKINFQRERKKEVKENIVLINMEHSHQICHNFKNRKLCLVPVKLNIVNCYGVPIKAFIDMSNRRDTSSGLGWVGALNNGDGVEANELGVSVSLEGLESRQVEVSALCASPGTYLLGAAFTVTVNITSNTDKINQISHPCNNPSLLVVQQA